jgi:hypothetical protein
VLAPSSRRDAGAVTAIRSISVPISVMIAANACQLGRHARQEVERKDGDRKRERAGSVAARWSCAGDGEQSWHIN